MTKKIVKKKSKKKKYERVSIQTQEFMKGLVALAETLDENKIAIDEITFSLTNEETGKSSELKIFNTIKSYGDKILKQKKKKIVQ